MIDKNMEDIEKESHNLGRIIRNVLFVDSISPVLGEKLLNIYESVYNESYKKLIEIFKYEVYCN